MIAVLLAVALTAPDRIDVRLPADVAITAAGVLGFVVPELESRALVPAHCRICDGADNTGLPGTGGRDSLNAVDGLFHDALTGWLVSRATADKISSVLAFGVIPVGAVVASGFATGPHASDCAGFRNGVVIAESAAVSAALVQGVKFVAARKRPFVRYGTGSTEGTYSVTDPDSRIGFPSGHTALAASAGFSAAMTASLEDSPAAPWLWAGAALGTVTTATLRMMAEKHYFTDTLAGAAIGAASGVVFPLLHRRGGPLSSPSVSAGASGSLLAVSGSF
ncbi:MAG TPA: phosphatase PAP2 family protein [Myxococcales bacterium]